MGKDLQSGVEIVRVAAGEIGIASTPERRKIFYDMQRRLRENDERDSRIYDEAFKQPTTSNPDLRRARMGAPNRYEIGKI